MVLIWVLISLLGQTYAQSTCYALTMEGGGSHGAYEAGCVQYLAYNSPKSVAYNVVTGISTGALNAGGVAQFKQGNEQAMADFLVNTWLTLNGSASVYKEWDGGLIDGLLFQRGIYDNKPLVKTLNTRYTYGINRNITIGSTNLDTGLFGQFNESLGSQDIITAITCSACPPWYFPPTNFLGSTWVDGGVIINLDVFAAVNRCLDVTGGNQANIVVDMIFDNGDYQLPAETNITTLYVYKRVSEIKNYDGQMWFYYNAITAWPKVNYRYVIFPSQAMSGGVVPLDFNQTTLEWEVQLGKNDTAKILSQATDGRAILTERYLKNKSKIIYP